MIKNSNNEVLDLFLVYARPESKINGFSESTLGGGWFIQTTGIPSEILKMKVVCTWSVLQTLIEYYITKETLEVVYLGFDKYGNILEPPQYDIGEFHETDPIYIVTFDLAVRI